MTDAEFQTAFDEHKDAVYRFAWRMCASPAAAEDITQNVFVGLLSSPGRFDPARGTLRAGAASIALFALVGVGHILPAFHFALVAHRVCAEHGELIHEAGSDRAKAERAVKAGVKQVVFDRSGYLYHGRVKALADAAREGGLDF